jgi:hypothetical protein
MPPAVPVGWKVAPEKLPSDESSTEKVQSAVTSLPLWSCA